MLQRLLSQLDQLEQLHSDYLLAFLLLKLLEQLVALQKLSQQLADWSTQSLPALD